MTVAGSVGAYLLVAVIACVVVGVATRSLLDAVYALISAGVCGVVLGAGIGLWAYSRGDFGTRPNDRRSG